MMKALAFIAALLTVAALTVAFFYRPAHAGEDSIIACIDRGRVAGEVAAGILAGDVPTPMDFTFPNAVTEKDLEVSREWAKDLIAEVQVLMAAVSGTASEIGTKIMNDCAYTYGQEHSMQNKKMHDEPAPYIKPGQEFVSDAGGRQAECTELLKDHKYIKERVGEGRDTVEHMRLRARNSHDQGFRDDDWYASATKLLDEAEKALAAGTLTQWYEGYWHACYDGV